MSARTPLTRLVAAAASVVLVGSFAVACGDDDESASTTTAADTSSETTEASGELSITDPWVRPAEDLTGSNRSAIYMVIEGGAEDDALVAASVPSDITDTVEVHETVMADGDMADGDMADGDMADGDMEGESDGDMGTDTTMSGDDMSGDDMSGDDTGDMSGDGDDGSMGGGMMQMQEVDAVEIPAGETVMLEPGGYHIMLLDLKRELTPGETVEVTLTFEVAGERTVTAEVREA